MIELAGTIITGILTLLGVVITNSSSNKSVESKLVTGQAVTDEKIDQLRREVEKHNNVIERVPVIENKINVLEDKVDKLEDRINNLDRKSS